MGGLRRTGIGIMVSVFALLAGLAVAEVGVRVFSLAPPLNKVSAGYAPDPHLPFKLKPLTHDTGRTEEFAYDYKHNSAGFRDFEREIGKPSGTFRILGLGDSFTYGVGARFEETYLYQLEQKLEKEMAPGSRLEIIKAGIPRYFPEAERTLLEHYGLSYRPDLIVVGVLPNDVVDTFLGIDAVRVDPTGYLRTREANELGELGAFVYRYSHLGRLALRTYIDRKLQPRYSELYQNNGYHERDWQKMESEYGRMADLADSVGAQLVLLHIPQKGPWTDENLYLPRRLGAWAERRGVHFVDVLPAMMRHVDPERLYYPIDGHCTPEGYAIVAETLFRALIDRNLLSKHTGLMKSKAGLREQ